MTEEVRGDWMLHVHIEGRPDITAVPFVDDTTEIEAVGVVLWAWKWEDWDSEAFEDQEGKPYSIKRSDRVVLDSVEKR